MTEMFEDSAGDLERSVAEAIRARGEAITEADKGNVELALTYARQIDSVAELEPESLTKALYLGPHLLNALRELGCTPLSRGESSSGDEAREVPDRLAEMRARRGKS